ncbi:MAG: GNAT family N-acetyltransferase [Nonomuraea sp.]|nr:GNAT family N-acetyltransferase [Nonomuraea sp.]
MTDRAARTIKPASADRFDDVATLLAPKRPGAQACWCLSHRVDPKIHRVLEPGERRAFLLRLTGLPVAPGILAYEGDEVVGWAAVAPRAEVHFLTHGDKFPRVDDLAAWSIWCLKVRPGHRGQGVARSLVDGAVRFARDHDAPAVESYPVDNRGAKVDSTLAYVGTRALFESAGFTKVADTTATSDAFPRIVMRYGMP